MRGAVRLGLAGIERPVQHTQIAVHRRAAGVLGLAVGLEEIGRDHRRDHPRDSQTHQHRSDDRQPEVLEKLAGNTGHQPDRQEHCDDRERGCNNRQPDLVGGVDRRLISGLAHAHVPHDILDFNDRIVDQHPRDQPERQQRQLVESEAHQVHEPERRDCRQRNGDGGNHRGAPIAQEEEHHDHRQHGAFDHRRHRAFVLALGVIDAGEQRAEVDPWGFLGQLVERFQCLVVDRHIGRAARTGDPEGHHFLAIHPATRSDFTKAVAHRRNVGEFHRATCAQRNVGLRQVKRGAGIAQHPHRLARAGDLDFAARGIGVELTQGEVHLRGGHPGGLHPRGIERDQDLARYPAATRNRGHAGNGQQSLGDAVVDEPRQLLHRHVIGADREIADRIGRCLGLEHLRLENAIGQFAARLIDRVLHLGDRGVDVLANLELDQGLARSFGRGRADRTDPGNRADRRFDPLGDLSLDLGRRGTRLGNRDDHHRELDVGLVLHLHLRKADQPREHQADEEHDRHHRVADRPGGDVAKVHGLGSSPPVSGQAPTGRRSAPAPCAGAAA